MSSQLLPNEEEDRVRGRVNNTQVSVVLRPFASSIPMANLAFAIGNFIYAGFLLGWIPKTEAVTVGLILLVFVAPLQLFPSVMAFIARDTGGGTAFGIFGMAWVLQGIELVRSGGDKPNAAIGLYLLGLAAGFVVVSAVIFTSKPLLGTLLGISVLRTLGMSAIKFNMDQYKHVTGIVGLLLSAIAIYSGFAFMLEDMQLKPSPLTLRWGKAKKAMEGRTEDETALLTREAGVRRQL